MVDLPESDRLDSWKEIAAYLDRGLRTVYRWEKREGLPVHRHVHKTQSTVYAYRSEIDAWLAKRRPTVEKPGRRSQFWRANRGIVGRVAAGTSVILFLGLAWFTLPDVSTPQIQAIDFQERDWILVSTFDNRTGEEVFNGTLKAALERELVNSPHVLVVPRERVDDTLRLMKTPLGAEVDAELGQEICVRDGGIRALLTGRAEKLGSTYLLSATVVDPYTGVKVSSATEQARDQDDVVPAIGRLSDWVRENLGETLASIRVTNEKLERATTPSLRALQLYSEGMALTYQRGSSDWAQAEQLFREAVAEDPTFASAHVFLSWAITNQHDYSSFPERESLPHLQRAMDLAETASHAERLFISGTHYSFKRDDERACTTYKTLANLFPAHYWGVNNAATVCWWQGHFEEAVPYFLSLADLRPRSIVAAARAARRLAAVGKWSEAREYIERATRLLEDDSAEPLPGGSSHYGLIRVLPAMEHWQKGDLAQARHVVNQEAEKLKVVDGEWHRSLRGHISRFYMTLGQLDAADDFLESLDEGDRYYSLAQVSYLREDREGLRKYLRHDLDWYVQNRTGGIENDPGAWLLLLRAGLVPELRKSLSESALIGNWEEGSVPVSVPGAGQVDVRRLWQVEGQAAEISLLRKTVSHSRTRNSIAYFLGVEMLAYALEARGDMAGAVQILKEASRERKQVEHWAGPYWLRVQQQLARAYRKLGDVEKARTIEAELLKLLAYADRDHPILVQMDRQPEAEDPRPDLSE